MRLEWNLFSKELKCNTMVTLILPQGWQEGDRPYKTLWLLHGLKGDHTSWTRNTSIERYVQKYGIAVVMPEVQRSWYTDTAYEVNYLSYVTKELPKICRTHFRGMSDRREDNIVAGLSMGGYGALKAALLCPETYGACISLSGSLDITRKGRDTILNEWRGNFDFDMESPLELEGGAHDLYAIARRNHEQGIPFPKLYMWCGTEDALVHGNRAFRDLLTEFGVDFYYGESEGNHSWKWWDLHIQPALKYIIDGNGVDDTVWKMLREKASAALAETGAENVVVLYTERERIHVLPYADAATASAGDDAFFEHLKVFGDAQISRAVCLWKDGSVDLPSIALRRGMAAVHPANGAVRLLLQGKDGFVEKSLLATLPAEG